MKTLSRGFASFFFSLAFIAGTDNINTCYVVLTLIAASLWDFVKNETETSCFDALFARQSVGFWLRLFVNLLQIWSEHHFEQSFAVVGLEACLVCLSPQLEGSRIYVGWI